MNWAFKTEYTLDGNFSNDFRSDKKQWPARHQEGNREAVTSEFLKSGWDRSYYNLSTLNTIKKFDKC